MQIPEYVESGFENLEAQLEKLLREQSALPPKADLLKNIPDPNDFKEGSRERDIYAAQRYYALISLAVSEIVPVVKRLNKEDGTAKNVIDAVAGIGLTGWYLKKHLNALTLAGKYSYYAASMLVSTLLSIKDGFNRENNNSSNTEADTVKETLKTVGLDPDSILNGKIKLFKAYAYSNNDNAYQACERLCQNFKNIKKDIHELDKEIKTVIQNPLIASDQIDINNLEESLKLVKSLSQKLLSIEQKLIKLNLNEKLTDIQLQMAELPLEILKIEEDSTKVEPNFVLMSELPENKIPIKGKMYLEKQANGNYSILKYIMLAPNDEVVEGILDFNISGELTLAKLEPLRSNILEVTSERKHTLKAYSLERSPSYDDAKEQLDVISNNIQAAKIKLEATSEKIEKEIDSKNKTHFENVFAAIEKDIISPIQEQLLSIDVSKSYSARTLARLSDNLAALEEVNFSARAKQGLPYPEHATKLEETFSSNLKKIIDQLKQDLKTQIEQQEKRFNEALIATLKEEQVDFESTCNKLISESNKRQSDFNISKANEDTLGAEQTFYNECAAQLKYQPRLEELIHGCVRGLDLNNNEVTQKLAAIFLEGKEYQNIIANFKKAAEQVDQVITKGKLQLEMANTAKIETLKTEAKALAQKIADYQTALNNVSQVTKQLAEQHEDVYQEEAEKRNKINKQINNLLKKRENSSALLGIYKIPLDTSTTQLQTILSDKALYQPIENSLKTFEAANKDLRKSIKLAKAQHVIEKQNYERLIHLKSQITEAFKQKQFAELIKTLSGASISDELFKKTDCDTVIKIIKERAEAWTSWGIEEDEKNCLAILEPYIEKQKTEAEKLITKKEEDKKNKTANTSHIKEIQKNYTRLKRRDARLLKVISLAQTAEKALQNIRASEAKKIQTAYAKLSDYLPEETAIPAGQEYQTHQRNLNTITYNLDLLNAKWRLFELKKTLLQQQADLNNVDADLTNLKNIKPFQYQTNTSDPFAMQWEIYVRQTEIDITASRKNLATIPNKLVKVGPAIFSLTKELNSIRHLLSQTAKEAQEKGLPKSNDLIALLSIKDSIHKELINLGKQINALQEIQRQKNRSLNVQQIAFNQEIEKPQTYQSILEQAEKYEKALAEEEGKLNLHQCPNTLINDIAQGNVPANFIPDRDAFYIACEQRLLALKPEIDQLENRLIPGEKISDLDKNFNETLTQKITACETKLSSLQTKNTTYKNDWEALSQNNQVIQNSRQVIADGNPHGPLPPNPDYKNFELCGIKLKNRNFIGTPLQNTVFTHAALTTCIFGNLPNRANSLQNTNFERATLTRCTFRGSLEGTNLNSANVSTCNFEGANFRGVTLNAQTQIDWKTYGYDILRDNLANPHLENVSENDLTQLITLVHEQHEGGIPAKWVLNMLEEIAAAKRPNNIDKKIHLQAQQQRAVFFMQQIVPKLGFKALLELGHELVINKHEGDKNPYGFIRREHEWYHLAYGNTDTWGTIITSIKTQLDTLAEEARTPEIKPLLKKQKVDPETCTPYEKLMVIMNTKTFHTYGFGIAYFFFNPPDLATKWEAKKEEFVQSNAAAAPSAANNFLLNET